MPTKLKATKQNVLTPKERFGILTRDGFACRYCGRKPPEVRLAVDHIRPRFKKGQHSLENCITACKQCNEGKGKILLPKRFAPSLKRQKVAERFKIINNSNGKQIRVKPTIRKILKILAAKKNITISALIEELTKSYTKKVVGSPN